ncbi:MAG: hypothetical protein U0R69_06870 [Gaiellales bacterium]
MHGVQIALGKLGEGDGERADLPELGEPGASRGPHELDRHLQQGLEALGDELVDVRRRLGRHVGALLDEEPVCDPHQPSDVDRERARGREPAEADRRTAQAVRVSRTGRPLAE